MLKIYNGCTTNLFNALEDGSSTWIKEMFLEIPKIHTHSYMKENLQLEA